MNKNIYCIGARKKQIAKKRYLTPFSGIFAPKPCYIFFGQACVVSGVCLSLYIYSIIRSENYCYAPNAM